MSQSSNSYPEREKQLQYQKALDKGLSRREAKKYARVLIMGEKIPLQIWNSDSSMNTQNIKVESPKVVTQ